MEKFNKLTIIDTFIKISGNQKRKFAKCLCDCGKNKDIYYDSIIRNKTKSCGCIATINNIHFNTKHIYNLEFFTNNSNEFYYLLGLLYTDGNLNKRRNTVSICLQYKDKNILEKLSILIANKNITRVEDNKCILEFTNKFIYKILESWGLYSNKSLTLTVDDRLKNNSHFWRGCIDGDGSIFIRNTDKLTVGFCGTYDMVNSFLVYCKTLTKRTKANPNLKSRHLYSFDFYETQIGHYASLDVCKVLYHNSKEYFIERKHKNYISVNKKSSTPL